MYTINCNTCYWNNTNNFEITDEILNEIIKKIDDNSSDDSDYLRKFEFDEVDIHQKSIELCDKSLSRISKHFKEIKTNNSFNQSIDNLSDDIEILNLGKNFNQPVLKWPNKLKELNLYSNEYSYSLENLPDSIKILGLNKCTVPIKKLPKSLEELRFYSSEISFECEITEQVNLIEIYDPNVNFNDVGKNCENMFISLEHCNQLEFTSVKLKKLTIMSFNVIDKKIIFPPNLKKLSLKIKEYNFPFDNLPETLNNFELLINNYTYKFDNLPTNLNKFVFSVSNNIYEHDFNLPESVKIIELINCGINTICNLPIGLEELKFENNDYNSKNCKNILNTNILPPNIKKLKLYYDCVIDVLPKFLEEVEFENIIEINNLDWETNLKKITFNVHFALPTHNIKFPPTLKYIHFGNYFNDSIDNLPNSVEIIELGNHHNHEISHFPDNLKKINFGKKYKYSIDNLPDGVEEIIITSKYDKQITKLPLSLKKISIYTKYKFMEELKQLCVKQNVILINKSFF